MRRLLLVKITNINPQNYLSTRRTPGFLPLDIWRQQREPKFEIEKLLFPKQITDKTNFFKTQGNVSLSGIPIDQGLDIPLCSSYSQISPVDNRILDNLSLMKIDKMSPIQQYTASILSQNETIEDKEVIKYGKFDILGSSQTGSGKTLAYLFPLMNNLMMNYPKMVMNSLEKSNFTCQYPSILVLAPTRELAQQIYSISAQLSYRSFLRPVCLYGGEKPLRQASEIRKGLHLAICTPGRLLQFLNESELSLKHCQYLVIDEADRMLDMGFEPQLREIIENPEYEMPSKSNKKENIRQTALFSATFPKSVMKIATDFLRGNKCISVNVSYENDESCVPKWGKNLTKEQISNLSRIPKEVTQQVVIYKSPDNYERYSKYSFGSFVVELIKDKFESKNLEGQILIFTNTRNEADSIDRILYRNGYHSSALHGQKSQSIRNQIIDKFRKGTLKVLVATSVAARGLDFPNVRMVINAGIPTNDDDYVHRVGRTGRFGSPGLALTIFNPDSKPEPSPSVAKEIIKLIKDRGMEENHVPEEFIQFSKMTDKPSYNSSSRYNARNVRSDYLSNIKFQFKKFNRSY